MWDEHFFIDIQKRFGHRLANPIELRNKNTPSDNDYNYKLNLGIDRKPNIKGCKYTKNNIFHNLIQFSF